MLAKEDKIINIPIVNASHYLGEFEVDSNNISKLRVEELVDSFNNTLIPISQDTAGILEYYTNGPEQDVVAYDCTLWFRLRVGLPVGMIIIYCGVNLKIEVIHDLILQAVSIGGDTVEKVILAGNDVEFVLINHKSNPSH